MIEKAGNGDMFHRTHANSVQPHRGIGFEARGIGHESCQVYAGREQAGTTVGQQPNQNGHNRGRCQDDRRDAHFHPGCRSDFEFGHIE